MACRCGITLSESAWDWMPGGPALLVMQSTCGPPDIRNGAQARSMAAVQLSVAFGLMTRMRDMTLNSFRQRSDFSFAEAGLAQHFFRVLARGGGQPFKLWAIALEGKAGIDQLDAVHGRQHAPVFVLRMFYHFGNTPDLGG